MTSACAAADLCRRFLMCHIFCSCSYFISVVGNKICCDEWTSCCTILRKTLTNALIHINTTLFTLLHLHVSSHKISSSRSIDKFCEQSQQNTCADVYRVSHELRSLLRESVPYVKIYRYNTKHLYPKLNGYGDNGKRSLKVWQLLHTY